LSKLSAERVKALEQICDQFLVDSVYAFGSRADEVRDWLVGKRSALPPGASDVDVGVKIRHGVQPSVRDKVRLTLALEDLLDVKRVDLVCLDEADPFLAVNVIRGERLYARDTYRADEYDLYVLRRAGDLTPLERERMALILGEEG
jgi:predicted nucleotidyltransferase